MLKKLFSEILIDFISNVQCTSSTHSRAFVLYAVAIGLCVFVPIIHASLCSKCSHVSFSCCHFSLFSSKVSCFPMHSISDPVLTVSKPVCRGSAYACPCSLLKAFRVENCFKTVLRLETRERGRAHNQRLQQACDWFPFGFFFCFPFLI